MKKKEKGNDININETNAGIETNAGVLCMFGFQFKIRSTNSEVNLIVYKFNFVKQTDIILLQMFVYNWKTNIYSMKYHKCVFNQCS